MQRRDSKLVEPTTKEEMKLIHEQFNDKGTFWIGAFKPQSISFKQHLRDPKAIMATTGLDLPVSPYFWRSRNRHCVAMTQKNLKAENCMKRHFFMCEKIYINQNLEPSTGKSGDNLETRVYEEVAAVKNAQKCRRNRKWQSFLKVTTFGKQVPYCREKRNRDCMTVRINFDKLLKLNNVIMPTERYLRTGQRGITSVNCLKWPQIMEPSHTLESDGHIMRHSLYLFFQVTTKNCAKPSFFSQSIRNT